MVLIKSAKEIKLIKAASKIVFETIKDLTNYLRPGLTTGQINERANAVIVEQGARPAFLGYQGFPAAVCVSINDEVVHGIPGPRQLKTGDIVSLDIGVELNGYFGDAAITLPVGKVSKEAENLISVTRGALAKGIEQATSGNRLSNLSCAIQQFVEENGFSVVRQFVGHGIGSRLHEEPAVPNFGVMNQGPELLSGTVLAIEPMVTQGDYRVKVAQDGWTVVTRDGNLSAHFEDTVAVTDDGPEALAGILTL